MGATRFGLLGDIHAEDVRLAAALGHLRAASVDAILSVGDVVDGPGDVERSVQLLREQRVIGVRGNHDRWIVEGGFLVDSERQRIGWTIRAQLSAASLAWLAELPATREIVTSHGRLLLSHGVADDDMTRFEPTTALADHAEMAGLVASGAFRFIVGGHTHARMARRFGETLVVNAGTLTERGGRPGFAILDVSSDDVQFFDLR